MHRLWKLYAGEGDGKAGTWAELGKKHWWLIIKLIKWKNGPFHTVLNTRGYIKLDFRNRLT